MDAWYEIEDVEAIITPQLLFYPELIESNIREMIRIAGATHRLRPHIKTYKCAEVIQMQMAQGVTKFKCATLAESALLGETGARDVLVAYPIIGPAQNQLVALQKHFPNTRFSVLIDGQEQLAGWNEIGVDVDLFIDVNVGMNRTGADFDECIDLHLQVLSSAHSFRGWHCYDGHIHFSDLDERKAEVDTAFDLITSLLEKTDSQNSELVCGGSISFPIHAQHPERTLSPGTTLLWDQGYSHHFPDLDFSIAAVIATRVIGKPAPDLICMDVGHKAVAAEMEEDPIFFPEMPEAKIITHSEEHLVLQSPNTDQLLIGQVVYGVPFHICPTVALHESVGVVEHNKLTQRWRIAARNRLYT